MKTDPTVMPVLSRALRATFVVSVTFAFTGCAWFSDFKNQPRLEPWESFSVDVNDTIVSPRFNPQMSVPMQGTAAAGITFSYLASPLVVDSMSGLVNPHPVTEASLANGRMYYQINCAVCHGNVGDGDGSLRQFNAAYAFSPSLLVDQALGRSDGYLWGIMRNGRGLMPSYARIEEADRWDVVNYVRALQGRTDIAPVIGPLGMPGQNGTTVPRSTATAPGKGSPFMPAPVQLTPGSSGRNSATTGREKMSFPSGAPVSGGGPGHEERNDGAEPAQEMSE